MGYNGERRKQKAAVTKQKIFDSAEQLLASKDINEISVESIIKNAGVSKGSFYVHFASKDSLTAELINHRVKKADTEYGDFLASFSCDTSAKAMLLSLIGKIADVLIDEIGRDKMQTVYKAQITKTIDTEAVMSYNREIYQLFSDILERGINRGEFITDIPLHILTRHLMIAIRGVTYEWCIRSPEFDYKTEALEHFKIMLAGLCKPAAPFKSD